MQITLQYIILINCIDKVLKIIQFTNLHIFQKFKSTKLKILILILWLEYQVIIEFSLFEEL